MESKSVWKGIGYGAIGGSLAECLVMPLDVLKVRLQMQGADGTKQYSGLIDAGRQTIKSEGVGALYKGVEPALIRQVVYGGLRYGLYAPIRDLVGVDANTPKDKVPFMKKFIAGAGAGGLASFIANPTDFVKIRLQVDGMQVKTGKAPTYKGFSDCFLTVLREEGPLAFWKGSVPNLSRATVLAAFELSCYDEIKTQLKNSGLIKEGEMKGVFLSSMSVGLIATIVSNPFDVVKSRVMGQPIDANGKGKLYTGMIDCFLKSVKQEGVMSLYKGFLPTWSRLGPRGVIIFMTMEFLKKNFD